MDEWVDSELESEDSPRSRDFSTDMFANTPNNKSYQKVNGNAFSASDDGVANLPMPTLSSYRDIPVCMVPQRVSGRAKESKQLITRDIQAQSLSQVSMACNAVVVRGASGSYYVYHFEITSDFYKQKWVVCKRYSELYRLRKLLLTRLSRHKNPQTLRKCSCCCDIGKKLKRTSFPKRFAPFEDATALVQKRTSGLEGFISSACQFLAADPEQGEFDGMAVVCREVQALRQKVKEFLQFPLDHEAQHIRSIWQLKYVDARDVQLDTDSCPICLCEWVELDGNRLVLSPCGHFFHEHCINEWYRTRFDCPMCRTIAGEPFA